ncbi:MAG TPA: hypothetical protein IGR64_18980, partial [Leptolyngbyaceae cyanobacterium M65_K2018_010]|nr:hypothetical protein [Leptolyngbyaceae cyanobacterium M65_K2018_010]
MKPSPLLLTISTLWALCGAHPARSEDMALNFDLPVIHPPPVSTAAGPEAAPPKAESIQPLPIPPGATNPPMRFHSPQQLPQGVYRRSVAVSLNQGSAPAAILPPAPPLTPAPQAVALRPPADPPPSPDRPSSTLENQVDEVVLSFDVTPVPETLLAQPERPKLASADELLGALFEGEVNSLVARAVGSAEGTRTPTGDLTPAYYGHVDPGNQVWNMGTFSYQHGAKSAAEADQKQLKRLQSQSRILQQRALKQGLTLTLEETLNGIDLANQSPLAAIGRVGYIERLAEAKRMGYEGTEAIVVARTRSYINPDTQQWNAPGLGNTEAGISRDQRRRASQIARAIGAFSQEQPDLNPQTWVLQPVTEETSAPKPEASQPEADSPEPVDI